MISNDQEQFFESILLRLQWQKFNSHHIKKTRSKIEPYLMDPVLEDYRNGLISKAKICKHLNIHENDLLLTLVNNRDCF
jgi:hypothetical protein